MATHVTLFAWLMFSTRSSGLIVKDGGEGQGIVVALGCRPRPLSIDGRVQSLRTVLTPPHPPTVLTASPGYTVGEPSPDPALSPVSDTDASPSSAVTGPPNTPAMADRLGVLPPTPPASINPWMQASFAPSVRHVQLLSLWPQVAPCWHGGQLTKAVRLRLNLSSYGELISIYQLEDDDSDLHPPSADTLSQAKAAVAACSPYVDRGEATDFEVIFPFTPSSSSSMELPDARGKPPS